MSNKITEKNIVNEMETSFLDYAMSVIVSRALPDVRDGLKPVHRRILYAMNDLGNYADKPYKKSARIVGDVIGKYHPHGDSSVYSAMVRMAQQFSYRDPLVDGHGNFGSLDGDGAAAMRYTEARMSKMAMELLRDINKKTIDFQDNYDGSESEPIVLPAKFPNLLVNGANGIAVGMATNIPPHNLEEVIDGVVALINNKEITIEEISDIIKGPDFPLGATILGDAGIKKAYLTGKGSIKIRSNYEVVEDKKTPMIIIREIPYQLNKAMMVEKIADVAKNKIVEGIKDLRDESDKDGVRVVIELTQKANIDVVLNGLFKSTQMESSYSINMLALHKGQPQVMNIKEILQAYIDHQIEVTVRKLNYELGKAKERAHLLEGLMVAVTNIDDVVAIIRSSKTQEEALNTLIQKYELSDIQGKAILDMQLKRITGLEIEKLTAELDELLKIIEELITILSSEEKINEIIIEDLTSVKMKYGTPRRTVIVEGSFTGSIEDEDLIEEKQMIITVTKSGYIKRVSEETYKTQNRGGTGVKAMSTNQEDSISNIICASTHSDMLFFTNTGKVFRERTHRIPEFNRAAKGIPLVNLIGIEKEDIITNIISIQGYEDGYLVFVTEKGKIKKTRLSEYQRINKNGKKAIKIENEDKIIQVMTVVDGNTVIAASKEGKAINIAVDNIRSQGRVSGGVRLLRLSDQDIMVGCNVSIENSYALTLTSKGYGKATKIEEYRVQGRGGKGIKNINLTEKNGKVISFKVISAGEITTKDILIITKEGKMIRIEAENIKLSGRATLGVRMMKLKGADELAKAELVDKTEVSRETQEE